MPKIEAGDEKFWLLDGVPQQRGMWKILTFGDNVELKPIGEPTLGSSTGSVKFDEYTNAADAPYASTQALIDDLKTFFFRSVAGGGGGGVQTVTGDGVSGTATDVILTFPDADQVDDTTTTNKFFNPVTSGVLTGYVDSQNNNIAVSNATQPNLTTYLTLVVAGLDLTSRYRATVDFIISHDATNSNAVVDIKDFGTSVLNQVYTVEPKDNSNVAWEGISTTFTPNPLGGGQIQLQLDFGTDDNDDDTTMYFANLSLQKINE